MKLGAILRKGATPEIVPSCSTTSWFGYRVKNSFKLYLSQIRKTTWKIQIHKHFSTSDLINHGCEYRYHHSLLKTVIKHICMCCDCSVFLMQFQTLNAMKQPPQISHSLQRIFWINFKVTATFLFFRSRARRSRNSPQARTVFYSAHWPPRCFASLPVPTRRDDSARHTIPPSSATAPRRFPSPSQGTLS